MILIVFRIVLMEGVSNVPTVTTYRMDDVRKSVRFARELTPMASVWTATLVIVYQGEAA